MCMKVTCEKCSKPTWKGCGKHIEETLKDVPVADRCQCPRDSSTKPNDSTASTKPDDSKVSTT